MTRDLTFSNFNVLNEEEMTMYDGGGVVEDVVNFVAEVVEVVKDFIEEHGIVFYATDGGFGLKSTK